MKKTTWEDVPGILAQILEELRAGKTSSCCSKPKPLELVEHKTEPTQEVPAPVETKTEQPAPDDALDRKAIRDRVIAYNRENPDLRVQVRSIVASLTPTGDGKFDDVPDANLPTLQAKIEELINAA